MALLDIRYGMVHFAANQMAFHVLHHVLENKTWGRKKF